MSTVTIPSPIHRELELLGQTVVVIGGSAGVGFETARRGCRRGQVILTGRDAERLQHGASKVDAVSTAAFDATDPVAVDRFFHDLPRIDHSVRQYFRPIVPLQYVWLNRKKGAAMNQTDKICTPPRGSQYRWTGRPEAASALLQDVVGKAKSPCRLLYGVASLPLGAPVELKVIFELAG
jgi:hypothetical protein